MFRALRTAAVRVFTRIAQLDSMRLLVLGYISYVAIGWGMLCLPICTERPGATPLDHLFTAASAVSTTGLATVGTADAYGGLGEFVVLLLIQFGGLGYMTLSSFVMLGVAGGLSPLRSRVSGAALTLPRGFELAAFLKTIFWFTLTIEALGAAALYPVFVRHQAPDPVWQAVFHSVSAFCTAGFGLFSNSFEDYRDDVQLNVVIGVLSYLGAIGFIVLHDVWRSISHRKPEVTLTTKVILWSTLWISLVATVLFAVDEPTVRDLPWLQRWQASLFQVMSASTTVGFNTIPIGALSGGSLWLLTVVMVIGASPSGTGGGLKTTTVSALWAEMMSVVRRRDRTTFFGRAIPEVRMRAAVAGTVFYALTLSVGLYALTLVETASLPDQLFECASALGTVGLSRGITASLSTAGKIIVIGLMLVGRIGPVVLGMAFFRNSPILATGVEEDVAV